MKKSKIDQICEEVAYDLQIASSLVFKKQHVLLRGFAKIVIQGIAKTKYEPFDPMQYKTKPEEDWKKENKDEYKP